MIRILVTYVGILLFLFTTLVGAANEDLKQYRPTSKPRLSAGGYFNQLKQRPDFRLGHGDGRGLSKTAAAPELSGPVTEAINFARDDTLNGYWQFPPDNAGCVGPNHMLVAVNSAIEWYNKGTRVREYSESLDRFFTNTEANDVFDPRVLWDQFENRYVVIADEESDSDSTSFIHLAVSRTSNPNDGWYYQKINTKLRIGSSVTWLDFPSLGVDDDALYLTGNMFSFGGSYQGTRLWIIDKGLYSGGTSTVSVYDPSTEAGLSSQAFTIQPAHMYGRQPDNLGVYMISSEWEDNNGNNDLIAVFRVDDPLATSGGPYFYVQFLNPGEIHDNSSGVPEAPQRGSSYTIDMGDDRAQSCVWRDSILVGAFTVNPPSGSENGEATNFWFTANTMTWPSIAITQQGYIDGEDIERDIHTGYPSVSINQNGDIAIGFAACGSAIYAGAYVTVHQASDAPGAVQTALTVHVGEDYYVRSGNPFHITNRWGDYSSIAVDPSNDHDFWVFNQYAWTRGSYDPFAKEDGRWATAFACLLPDGPSFLGGNPPQAVAQFQLLNNYPNPFNPQTTIPYQLSRSARVDIQIFDQQGRLVKTLHRGMESQGLHEARFSAPDLSSGVYFYRLLIDGQSTGAKKMMLVK